MVRGATSLPRCRKGHLDIRHFKDGQGWICSACGTRRATFGESWGYFGSLECVKCGWPAIEWVACSDVCRLRLMGVA